MQTEFQTVYTLIRLDFYYDRHSQIIYHMAQINRHLIANLTPCHFTFSVPSHGGNMPYQYTWVIFKRETSDLQRVT